MYVSSEKLGSNLNQAPLPDRQKRGWLVASLIIAFAIGLSATLWLSLSKHGGASTTTETAAEPAGSVDLNARNLASIEVVPVTTERPSSSFTVPATVEANQQQLQQMTPLVAGRVDNITVSLGDQVHPGMLLVSIDSPQVAELHGKLHEAETRLKLATLTLNRVQQQANRVNILKAKATLEESDANFKRVGQLVSEGLIARKELVAAQADNDRAQADYNFQKDISLNKEVAEARAEYKTAQTESEHIKDGLRALDAHLPKESEGREHDISAIELRSPIAGTVIERFVNPGSGCEPGKPLLTIANTSTLWVIANVPEKQMARIHTGVHAKVSINGTTINGVVNYIDPRLNEDTRTARVRIEVKNIQNKLQVGSFAQVTFTQPSQAVTSTYVPESAVQTVENQKVVFVKDQSGQFALRKVETSAEVDGKIPVLRGLKEGEKVAATGSFILKSKLLKEQFGDED